MNCIINVVFHAKELPEVAAGLDSLLVLSNSRLRGIQLINVCDLLALSNSFLATDLRDKVYGMLGMNNELCQLVPHPNYANSKDDVYRDLIKALLARGYKLDLIRLKVPTHVNRSDVASWVPNWDVHGLWTLSPIWLHQVTQDHHSRTEYYADAGKDAVISYVGDGSILRVRGVSFDKIDGLGSTWADGYDLGTKMQRYYVVEPDHSQNAYGSDVDTFKVLKHLSQEIFRSSRLSNSQAAVDGYNRNNECLIPRIDRQIAFMELKSVRTKITLLWLQGTEEFCFVGTSLQQWYEMACTHGQASPLASSSSDLRMDPELDGMIESIRIVANDGWRWLSTDRGYIGRTHPQTLKGDELVIVEGCSLPMVLRPCGKYYSVVCAAYVQGIMNGEALEGVSNDQMRYFDLA